MSSLLWKGLQLETARGSLPFLALVVELWASSSAIMCGVYWLAASQLRGALPELAAQYARVCAVGFSGVLFGMKAVINAGEAGWQRVSVPFLGSMQMPPKVCLAGAAGCPQCGCIAAH